MHVFIVYAHPSDDSFTRHLRDSFLKGLQEGKHTFEISDLYKMNFKTDISEVEYLREANFETERQVTKKNTEKKSWESFNHKILFKDN